MVLTSWKNITDGIRNLKASCTAQVPIIEIMCFTRFGSGCWHILSAEEIQHTGDIYQ